MWNMMDKPKDRLNEMHEAYVASLPVLTDELRAAVPTGDAARLDGSVESLDFANEWYLNQLRRTDLAAVEGVPLWWNPAIPTGDEADRKLYPLTRAHLKLVDQTQAYLAEVLAESQPSAKWIIYKGRKRDSMNGQSVLDLGSPRAFPVRVVVYGEAIRWLLLREDPEIGLLTRLAREQLAA